MDPGDLLITNQRLCRRSCASMPELPSRGNHTTLFSKRQQHFALNSLLCTPLPNITVRIFPLFRVPHASCTPCGQAAILVIPPHVKEKFFKKFLFIFVNSSLDFLIISKSSPDISGFLIYITTCGNFLLQRVIHIFHTLFHIL